MQPLDADCAAAAVATCRLAPDAAFVEVAGYLQRVKRVLAGEADSLEPIHYDPES